MWHEIPYFTFLFHPDISIFEPNPNPMKRIFSLIFLSAFTLSGTAQNFTGGFNFNLPFNDSTTVDFLPNFPLKEIGPNDFISTDSAGNFILNTEPIRFFGGNLTTQGAFPIKNDAVKIAGRMRKMGINLIRFHHIDNPWSDGSLFEGITGTRNFNQVLLDRLDYLIYQLKLNGIYVNMNLNVSRTFENVDGVYAADSLEDYGKGITLFNRHMIDLEKEYAQMLLGHVNPYTGIPLAEDPVLAMVEIVNENSLFRRWYGNKLQPISEGGSLPLKYSQELDSLFHVFLLEKYETTQNLSDAWNQNRLVGDTIIHDNFEDGLNTQVWQMELHEGAQGTFDLFTDEESGNSVVHIETTKHGSQSWHITFKNVGGSVKKDSVYELHFKAKCDTKTTMSAGLQRNNSPWTYYGGGDVAVETEFKSFKVVVKAPENNNGNLRIWFRFGNHVGDFYLDDVVFKEVSTLGLDENETFENENIRRISFNETKGFSIQRISDQTDFYIQTQVDFFNEMKSLLKDTLGVQAPLAGTNWYVGPEDAYVQNTLDYLDNHAYWDHPHFPNQPWSQTDWTINNQPMMKGTSATIERLFNGLNVKNKPYTVSEYNHGYPNQFQAEMLPMITSYLSFNGADGIMFFTYSGSWDWNADALYGYFDLHRNHAVMAGFPIYSYVFRNNLISEAQNSIAVNFQKADILKMPLQAENSWGTHSPFPRELSYTNKVELTFNEEQPTDLSQIPEPDSSPYSLNNGEVFWDKNGIFKINTEKFNCIAGELDTYSGTKTNQMTLVSGSGFGAVSWLSLVDSALHESSKSVIFIGSKQINTDMLWDGTTSVHNNWGGEPSLIAPLNMELKLKTNFPFVKIYPLNEEGETNEFNSQSFATGADGYATVTLDQKIDKTLWYGIKGTQSNELGPYLVLSEEQFEFEAKPDNSKSFTINSSVNWSVSSSEPWLNVDITSGSNNGTISITADENSTVEERTAVITVSGEEVSSQTIAVTQSAGAPFLDVSTFSVFLEAGAGSIDSFLISSNINWNISISQPWLQVNLQNGSNSQNIILTAEENFSLNKRRAVVRITGNGVANRILTIEQNAGTPVSTVNLEQGSLLVFPNPSDNVIKFENTIPEQFDLQIFDLTGRALFKGTANNSYRIHKEELGTGIFLYRAMQKDKIYQGKIVFQ